MESRSSNITVVQRVTPTLWGPFAFKQLQAVAAETVNQSHAGLQRFRRELSAIHSGSELSNVTYLIYTNINLS
jgi:hypothetical protein